MAGPAAPSRKYAVTGRKPRLHPSPVAAPPGSPRSPPRRRLSPCSGGSRAARRPSCPVSSSSLPSPRTPSCAASHCAGAKTRMPSSATSGNATAPASPLSRRRRLPDRCSTRAASHGFHESIQSYSILHARRPKLAPEAGSALSCGRRGTQRRHQAWALVLAVMRGSWWVCWGSCVRRGGSR